MKPYFSHLILLTKRLGLAFLVFSLCRILFYLFNTSHFSNVPLNLFFYGLRFDVVAVSYLFLPFIALSIIPFSFRDFRSHQRILAIFFYTGNTIGIILNLIDLAYFDFTLKRITTDFFSMIAAGGGNDFIHLFYLYVIDFWYDYILLAGLIILSWFIYKKYCRFNGNFNPYLKKDYLIHSSIFIFFLGLTIIGTRGGLQYKPISIINAGQYAKAQNIPIVLNSPFTVFKTLFKDNITKALYFSEKELKLIYTPKKKITPHLDFNKKNIVIIILESFAKEYVGGFNNGKGYTLFLDSLITKSYIFNNAYANGQKSIEALPSILAGLPSLMNTPYVVSNYTSSSLDALPKLLKQNGYNTSFYHSGDNGTMGFNGFVGANGIDSYYGINEYPNKKKDFDGFWGIFDEPYLQYYAHELNNKPEPFFSSIFTISSHHPYTIPKQHTNKFPKGDLPLHETVGYTDYALQQFFNTVKKMPWFNNSLFVITADHSAQSISAKYKSRLGRFAVPMLIYDPTGNLKGENNNLFQHADISPTILSLVGVKNELISFGNNAFNNSEKFAIQYINNTYQIATKDNFLIFDGEKTTGFYYLANDSLLQNNFAEQEVTLHKKEEQNRLERKLKAIIQQYNNRLINNNLSYRAK